MENTWPTTQQFQFYKSDSKVVEGTTLLHLHFFKDKLNNSCPLETRSYVTICRDALNPKPMSAVKSELNERSKRVQSAARSAELKKDTRIHRWVCLPHWNQHGKDGRHRDVFISLGNLIYSYRWEHIHSTDISWAPTMCQILGWVPGTSHGGAPLHPHRGHMDGGLERLIREDPWLHPGEGWTTAGDVTFGLCPEGWGENEVTAGQWLVRCAWSLVCARRIAGSLVRVERKAKQRAPSSRLSGKRSQSNVPLQAVGRLFFSLSFWPM